ncbi:MAG: 5-oxoprolinase/urea amidolyase family protein [Actinotalea sp.]|nr:5-oxoprolinase/urea amidolyase family protein [Actinotalea sp.]
MTGHPAPRVLPVGDRALLVECADSGAALALWRRWTQVPPPGVQESVVAARSVLLRVAEGAAAPVRSRIERLLAAAPGEPAGAQRPAVPEQPVREVVVPTVYDGEDLAAVAEALRTSVEALVARHTATGWTSAFLGFAPGFAYLQAQEPWPQVPRRASPRTRVPGGSVALAGGWSAVYPGPSPGGWQLLGRTDTPVWDLDRPDPALLTPGTRVQFRAVRARALSAGASVGPDPVPPAPERAAAQDAPGREVGDAHERAAAPGEGSGLEVLESGPLCLVQDLGRRGHLTLGVPTSGALDRRAAVRANRLVGNDRDRAVLEVLLGGLVLRARQDVVVAVAGAAVPVTVVVDGRTSAPPAGLPFLLRSGTELTLGTPAQGLRTYVAVRGGIDAPQVLGSRATDVLSGLGPPPVRPGDVLRLLAAPGTAVPVAPDDDALEVPAGPEHVVRVAPGPRADWITPEALGLLGSHPWVVTDRSNRVGLRLAGPALERSVTTELPSEGTVPGAVQVPPDGRPVVFLADHPVTGGYPVVAVVVDEDLDLLGQVRPGERVRLLPLATPHVT